jgi:hypothetical protein
VEGQPAGTDPVDGDPVSYDGAATIDIGDENVANAPFDVPENSVAAVLIRVKIQ